MLVLTINVDARYVLFVIDKFAGATNLIEELTIVKSEPEVVNEEDENSIDYEYERFKRIIDEELKKMEDL